MKFTFRGLLPLFGSAFGLYLLIHYWPSLSGGAMMLLGAASSLILGAVIAYIVNIPMSFFERVLFRRSRSALARIAAMILAVLSVGAIAYLVVQLVVPELYHCFMLLFQEIPPYLNRLWTYLNENYDVAAIIQSTGLIPSIEDIDVRQLAIKAINILVTGVGGVMNAATALLTAAFSFVVAMLLSVIFAVYVLMGKERIGSQIHRLLRAYLPEKANDRVWYVLGVVDNCFHKFLVGQCTEAIILGGLCMLGMKLFGFPYATMIGALIGFTALIPIAGAYIGAGVGAFMIFTVAPMKALLFLVFIVVLQQLEGNIVYPRVVGASIGLPGIWVLAAITVGGGLAGVVGMLAGVPLVASIYQLVGADVRRREALESAKDIVIDPPKPV